MNAQEKQAKYEWLAEFYCQAAEGGVVQESYELLNGNWSWDNSGSGPAPDSDLDDWRIKPELKVIDLSPLIGSGILCEFWTNQDSRKRVDFLESIDVVVGRKFFRREGAGEYLNCTPMMNHPNYWRGESDKCPVPEGFEVRLHTKGKLGSHASPRYQHEMINADIIGIEFIAVKEGYTLTPAC
jgi:hypothetical protein